MERHEADREAWEAGEHPCQLHGHVHPQSLDTNEPLPCVRCHQPVEVTQTQTDATDDEETP